MEAAESPAEGQMGSLFTMAAQDSSGFNEGAFLQQGLQVSNIFDVLQGNAGTELQQHQQQQQFQQQQQIQQQQQQQQQLQQEQEQQRQQQHQQHHHHQQQQHSQGNSMLGAPQGMQALLEEVGRSFLKTGSLNLDQAVVGNVSDGGIGNRGGNPPQHASASGSGRGAIDLLSAQVAANAAALGVSGKDSNLEELLTSGQISADSLLSLIDSLKSILPTEQPSSANFQQQQSLAALAEILGLSQGESKGVPEARQLESPQQQDFGGEVQAMQKGGLLAMLGVPQAGSLSAPNTPGARSNLGPPGLYGHPSGLGPSGGQASGTGVFAAAAAGSGSGSSSAPGRQASSLRNRRGLPDLPVHRPSALRSASPMSPLTQGATIITKSSKRLANGTPATGVNWPLSPVSKSPRAEGQMSPGGNQLAMPGSALKLPGSSSLGGSNFPASPTASLLGDMSRLNVQRPATPSNAGLMATGVGAAGRGEGMVKSEPGALGLAAGQELLVEEEGAEKEGDGDGGQSGDADLAETSDPGGDDFGVAQTFAEGDAGSGGEGMGLVSCNRPKHSTKPRSVAERLRRERIAVRLQRLKEVMPKTDARIDTSAMLEDAVVYIRSLQSRCRSLEKQNEMLQTQVARLSRQQGGLGQSNPITRPMGP